MDEQPKNQPEPQASPRVVQQPRAASTVSPEVYANASHEPITANSVAKLPQVGPTIGWQNKVSMIFVGMFFVSMFVPGAVGILFLPMMAFGIMTAFSFFRDTSGQNGGHPKAPVNPAIQLFKILAAICLAICMFIFLAIAFIFAYFTVGPGKDAHCG